ncbi:TPA: hypothetical protein DEP21_02595 [Patescibacteria group bacterium]|nr:hypothetical protein [Candidatus Gracilibacteria bacterium]
MLIKLFYPYIPSVSSSLRELMEIHGNIEDPLPNLSMQGVQKNYLISLFMDLIDKLSSIKTAQHLKKHDMVSIFITSNPDFLKFTKSNEDLLKKVLHAEEILYFTHNEKYPSGYSTEEIIDIVIGLKVMTKEVSSSSLSTLQKQLIQKEEYLQHTKLVLQSLTSN